MEPAEVEFLAEKEQITIVPNFSENKLYLISGEFGPFNPSMQTRVPLWLAINLRQRQKCHIVPPDWLNVGQNSAQLTEWLIIQDSYLPLHLNLPPVSLVQIT
ncbi:DNA replication complex GINS protein PSF2 [Geodia barretti]|uniref:DNA replication complex GINS protein PSF2 n=1 Tax=Geodia barretti TaxID=519541 RepID=A0AA35RTA0_GEOBA|nr:DNA replication complex GINS protein PSF2 [Geodia barretti]